ncbi:hypothetical protein [Galbibacter pacificus]|uniref:Replication protein n=1 Tax=Galbibacter pacificus TaxID=2996052 RepID=A0ABT6FRQ8_9FLAO|nr:hypothetical protein [Galbibacter pacificus]MDG3582955.1 hypothetical protein [Galbibacter pacificus]MDG3585926.1 hypothetical protein [Galbibacter pacificus]
MKQLHHYQYDFIEITLPNVNRSQIKWQHLKPHPTLHNYYQLKANSSLHGDRFGMFVNGNGFLKIKTSIPYLLHNHNYISVDESDLLQTILLLSDIIGLKLIKSHVTQIEYGAYERINQEAREYLSKIIGVYDYQIEKSSNHLKMFGNGKLHYKIYDAVKNAKSKKTYRRGNYPKENLIKHELKLTDVSKVMKKPTSVEQLCQQSTKEYFDTMLHTHHSSLCLEKQLCIEPIGNTFSDVLYAGLKQLEQQYGQSTYTLVSKLIDTMKLSPSQKSKRRKSLQQLETIYNEKAP